MHYSEAREIRDQSGSIRIFCASGESWRAVASEVPNHLLSRSLRGGGGQVYATDAFIEKFCHESGLITQPEGEDILLIPAERIASFDAERLEHISTVLWSDGPGGDDHPTNRIAVQQPFQFQQPAERIAHLRSIDLNFMTPLKLPDGSDPPASALKWVFGLTEAQLSPLQREFADMIERTFSSPGQHRMIGADMARKVRDFYRRYMGVLMGQLKIRRSVTTTLQILDPNYLSYYFKFVAASKKPGRNYQFTTLNLEVNLMSHFVDAMRTHALRETMGLNMDQLKNYDIDDVASWLKHEMMHAVAWKRADAGRGPRRQEREVVNRLVTEAQYDAWEGDVLKTARDLMRLKQTGQMQRDNATATAIQDLFCCLCLGPGKPPLRADVLRTLQHPSSRRRCPVPGCGVRSCHGNRVVTRSELVRLQGDQATNSPPDVNDNNQYAIVCGHYKNYSGNRATYRGPKVFTASSLGPELSWALSELVTWASKLLSADQQDATDWLASSDDDEDENVQDTSTRTCYLLTDYEVTGSPFYEYGYGYTGTRSGNHDGDDETVSRTSTRTTDSLFCSYIKRVTYPICQPPTSFRFLFARAAEKRIARRGLSHLDAEETRRALADEMLTSLEKWHTVYARPAVRLAHSGYDEARAVMSVDASSP